MSARTPARALLDKAMTESEWQAQVRKYARRMGWLVYHTRFSAGSDRGFPDLVFVRERVVYAELKREDGSTTEKQDMWMDRLVGAGQEVYEWRPSEWAEVQQVLA